jgi:hypothetical protein
MSDSWGLVVAFPDSSPSFVHGFEAGQIWQMMQAGVSELERTIHAANEEVIRRMCTAEGYEAKFAPSADEFGTDYPTYRVVHIRKVKAAPERPNPHGLRVVAGQQDTGGADD